MKITSIATAMGMMLLTLCYGCTYDTLEEEDLSPNECFSGEVSYTVDIAPILELSCTSCHNAGFSSGGISVDGYDDVKNVVDLGRLLGPLRHDAGFSPMPRGAPKLDDCSITLFQEWIAQGAPNN